MLMEMEILSLLAPDPLPEALADSKIQPNIENVCWRIALLLMISHSMEFGRAFLFLFKEVIMDHS